MTASAWSVAMLGLEGRLVEIEAALGGGLPKTLIVGLPDAIVSEAKERCRAAVNGSDARWPAELVTINLTPATLPKSGSHFELGIAMVVLALIGWVPETLLGSTLLMGELMLDGRVKRVDGVLPGVLAARKAGFERVVVPASQAGEAELVPGIMVWGVATLSEAVAVMRGEPIPDRPRTPPEADQPIAAVDLADVVGQPEGRWALEVAAAGGHHLFLHGPPGVGKTMLASRLPGLLPDLTGEESVEVSAVYSLVGRDLNAGLMVRPPFSDPHHSATIASLVGGGPSRLVRPGAVSLAHRGVLFLDEAPEFGTKLEALRTPMESGWVRINRAACEALYPARFLLVLAANPCPCGNANTAGLTCTCTPMVVRRYGERVSGPILDRIDIQQPLLPIRRSILALSCGKEESTATVAARVHEARARQARRLVGTPWSTNGQVPGAFMRRNLPAPQGAELLDQAVQRGRLSARGVDKIARLAWTLADLAGRDTVQHADLHQALALRRCAGALAP